MKNELPQYEIDSRKKRIMKSLMKVDERVYEKCVEEESFDGIINIARDYYEKNYPVELDLWRILNEPKDTLIYHTGFYAQLNYVEVINRLLSGDYDDLLKVNVVSTHMSKSVTLPVYLIELKDVKIYMRENFHGWVVSIDSPYNLEIREIPEYAASTYVSSCYCEGFKEEWKFKEYAKSHTQFTLALQSNEWLFTFIYLLKQAITRECNKIPISYMDGDLREGEILTSIQDPIVKIQIISILQISGRAFNNTTLSTPTLSVEYTVYRVKDDIISLTNMTYDEIRENYLRQKKT